jgi:hypothetical protein
LFVHLRFYVNADRVECRVTRLGEFPPIGRFTLDSLLKITEVAQTIRLLENVKYQFCQKN